MKRLPAITYYRQPFLCSSIIGANRLTLLARLCLIIVVYGLLAACVQLPVRDYNNPRLQKQLSKLTHVKLPFVRQSSPVTCGLATLESVSRYWEVIIDQDQVYRRYPPKNTTDGYSLGEIKNIASRYGLRSYIVKVDIAFLKRMIKKGRPIIVAIKARPRSLLRYTGGLSGKIIQKISPNYNHFVVVMGFNDTRFVVMDPVQGFYQINMIAFEKAWRSMGYAAFLVAP